MPAATKIAIEPGYGYIEFQIGDTTSSPIDLYAASDRFDATLAEHTVDGVTDWDAVWTKMREYLATFGIPTSLSTAGVVSIVNSIRKSIEGLQKKDLPLASSGGPG